MEYLPLVTCAEFPVTCGDSVESAPFPSQSSSSSRNTCQPESSACSTQLSREPTSETSIPRVLARSIQTVWARRKRYWPLSKLVSFRDGAWRTRVASFIEDKGCTEDIFVRSNRGKRLGLIDYQDCCQREIRTELNREDIRSE